MRLVLTFVSVIFCLSSLAQLSPGDLNNNNWRIIPGVSNKNAFLMPGYMGMMGARMSLTGPFEAGRISLSPTEQLVGVSINDREFAVIRITEDQKITWASPLSGVVMKIGVIGDKVVVIHGGDMKDRKVRKNIEATVLNLSNGKKISNKTLYLAPEEFLAETKIFFPAGSNEFYLGFRHTNSKNKVKILPYGIGASKMVSQYMTSSKFELITYDVSLKEIAKTDIPFKTDVSFIQAEMNAAKEIFIVYEMDESSISVERIASNHKEIKDSKRINLDLRKNASPDLNFYLSRQNDNVCFLTFRYKNADKDRAMAIYKVDFNTGESKSYTEVVDKAYKENLKSKYNPSYENAGRLNPGEWYAMEITGFVEHGDKIIFLKEALVEREYIDMGSSYNRRTAENGDGVISVYDQNLKLLDEVAFAKSSTIGGIDEAASSLNIIGNKVIVVAPSGSGIGINSLVFEYDLSKKQIVKRYNPERGDIRKSHSLVSGATLWFGNSFMIPVQTDRGYYDTNLRLLKVKP